MNLMNSGGHIDFYCLPRVIVVVSYRRWFGKNPLLFFAGGNANISIYVRVRGGAAGGRNKWSAGAYMCLRAGDNTAV